MPRLLKAVTGIAAAIVAAGLMGAAAPAPDTYWAQRPTPAQINAAWPAAAAQAGTPGRALMVCKAGADGGLGGCRLVMDSPSGEGFGPALLTMAPQFRVNMTSPHAPAAGGDVNLYWAWVHFDTGPDWLRKPTVDDLVTVWPKKAWARGQGGKATISCWVSVQGALYDCVVTSETPAGEHFGDAAIALAPQLIMRPAKLKGEPVVSPVNIPFNFMLPPGSMPQAADLSGRVVSAVQAWAEAPSYADVAAAYPAKARAAKLGGRATVSCKFNKEGRLYYCDPIGEEPWGQGFGTAAKALAKAKFRANPTLTDGTNIAEAGVQLLVVFDPAMLDPAQPVIGKAQWASLPSAADTTAAFGKLAVTGTARAMLTCVVQSNGAVGDCRVAREEPEGSGVGAAALSLTPHFRLTTWSAEGLPTIGGAINIPLRYEASKAQPAPAAPAPKG